MDDIASEIAALAPRHAKGIDWIREHDPDGSMYFWIESGLLPSSPMPGQSAERIEAWREFYRQYQRWLQIDKTLAKLEHEQAGL